MWNKSYQSCLLLLQNWAKIATFWIFAAFQPEMVYKHRLDIQDLTKNAHDMYLMGMTMACIGIPTERHDGKERKKQRAKYRFWVSSNYYLPWKNMKLLMFVVYKQDWKSNSVPDRELQFNAKESKGI